MLDGLGACLHQAITIEGGRVVEANYNTFPLLRMREAPPVEVYFNITDNAVTGLGEPGLPPALPALCQRDLRRDRHSHSLAADRADSSRRIHCDVPYPLKARGESYGLIRSM